MILRILCLGIGSEYAENYTYYTLGTTYPTIFDYEIVMIDLNSLDSSYYRYIATKKAEFKKFFKSKGICYVLMSQLGKYGEFSNYDWCPFADEIEIVNKSGETLTCQSKNAKFLFDSAQFKWKCFFSKYPEDTTVLAVNRANDPISIMVPCENGYCIFLPFTDESARPQLLDLLIKRGLSLIPEEEETHALEKKEQIPSVSLPPWATDYMSKTEADLLRARNEIDEKLGKYNKFKPLFWETGDILEELVIQAFEELGINVTRLEKASHGDFEFAISKSLTGVCEIKGLLGSADRRNLRQLLDYFIEQRDIEKRNVKGILIVNHHRTERPTERGKPATNDALDLIRTYNFHILTTIQLYEYLTQFWQKKLVKDDFLKTFQE